MAKKISWARAWAWSWASALSWPAFVNASEPQFGWRQVRTERWGSPWSRLGPETEVENLVDRQAAPDTEPALELAGLSAGSVIALVGLAFEARIAAGPGVLVICRGPGGRAAELLPLAVRSGCRSIISFGVAGGLSPDLNPGDCVVASTIVDYPTLRPTDPLWSDKLLDMIPTARHGPIVGVNAVVSDPADKRKLHALTGAVAVDMESHLVARLAVSHGLPFAALRVVVDPAHRMVPSSALLAMAPGGGTDLPSMLWEILARPSQLAALMRIAADAYAARAALIRLRRALGPDFRCG